MSGGTSAMKNVATMHSAVKSEQERHPSAAPVRDGAEDRRDEGVDARRSARPTTASRTPPSRAPNSVVEVETDRTRHDREAEDRVREVVQGPGDRHDRATTRRQRRRGRGRWALGRRTGRRWPRPDDTRGPCGYDAGDGRQRPARSGPAAPPTGVRQDPPHVDRRSARRAGVAGAPRHRRRRRRTGDALARRRAPRGARIARPRHSAPRRSRRRAPARSSMAT